MTLELSDQILRFCYSSRFVANAKPAGSIGCLFALDSVTLCAYSEIALPLLFAQHTCSPQEKLCDNSDAIFSTMCRGLGCRARLVAGVFTHGLGVVDFIILAESSEGETRNTGDQRPVQAARVYREYLPRMRWYVCETCCVFQFGSDESSPSLSPLCRRTYFASVRFASEYRLLKGGFYTCTVRVFVQSVVQYCAAPALGSTHHIGQRKKIKFNIAMR